MKKAFDQTVRDLKREVNKKVLKVPSIEQKVLDATSNEPWGPHGSHLADIAQATRNYHEYQMIMAVIWKRINDTGKNWRHVYKALTVLEYLVAHGSERVIDEIREHAYQISTLSDFQYIDSSGRDQGNNVRKKSQSLVVLVNDKERIQEVRQKAAANRDKFRNTSVGSMYRPGSHSGTGGYGDRYDDDRYEGHYGNRDEDRNGYGREREWGYRDEDKSGRYGEPYGRDGDRYGRDSEEHYGRDAYRDDDHRGRSRSIDEYQYGSRSRSSDRYRDRAYEDDGQYSSRGSGAKADDNSQDSFAGRRLDRKFSEQNLGAPPSYEEALGEARSPVYSERDGETSASMPKSSSPPATLNPNQGSSAPAPPPPPAPAPAPANNVVDGFDEFDPRGSFSAAPTVSNGAEILGPLSYSFSSNALAIVPATSGITTSEADASTNSSSAATFMATPASTVSNQAFEDPFGDGPFKAFPSTNSIPPQPQNTVSSFQPSTNQISEQPELVVQKVDTINNLDFGDTLPGITYTPSSTYGQLPSSNSQYLHQELSIPHQNTDILADILPPPGPSPPITSRAAFPVSTGQTASQLGFPAQTSQPASQTAFPGQTGHPASLAGFPAQSGQPAFQTGFPGQTDQPISQTVFPPQASQPPPLTGFPAQTSLPTSESGFPAQSGQATSLTGFTAQIGCVSQAGFPAFGGQPAQPSASIYGSFSPQPGSAAPVIPNTAAQIPESVYAAPAASQLALQTPQARPSVPMASQPALPASTGSIVVPQPSKDKFEAKSTVWADTLSRGLVNLNISGSKTNPLADIGIDFEAINRKEKRMEKPTAPVTSNVTMGKAMGSGSGIGRAGAIALRPTPNAMTGSGMGVGLGGPGVGIGMGGYGVNQHLGVGRGMNTPVNMGVGMNMAMGQGVQMQPPAGFPTGSIMPGAYNPMMGAGGYGQQQPYGGGYR